MMSYKSTELLSNTLSLTHLHNACNNSVSLPKCCIAFAAVFQADLAKSQWSYRVRSTLQSLHSPYHCPTLEGGKLCKQVSNPSLLMALTSPCGDKCNRFKRRMWLFTNRLLTHLKSSLQQPHYFSSCGVDTVIYCLQVV